MNKHHLVDGKIKKKRIVVTGIILFLMIISWVSMIVNAETYEKENVILNPYDIESELILWISKDKEIQFNVTSNISVHVYIMTSDAYHDAGWSWSSPYDENDFNVNLVEKKNVQEACFTWIKPDDQSYYLVIFNPNNISAMISYSYTETLFEELGEAVGGIFAGICVGTMCIVGIIFYFFISLIIAYWMLKDADKRGRNGIIWFIIGLILGIIGLIIWYLIRPKVFKEGTKKKDVDRRCPSCGRIIPEDARTCPYCSKKFEDK